MGIVRFALRFPYTFYVLAALVVFLGVSAITVMPEDIFPEINIPVVTVIWQYTGLTTEEMEERVTTYSQYAISTSVSGVKNMEAQTLNGISVIKIFFPPDGRPCHLADRCGDELYTGTSTGRNPSANSGELQRFKHSGPANQPGIG
jgi:multidrug efflux pump subunit AcrB